MSRHGLRDAPIRSASSADSVATPSAGVTAGPRPRRYDVGGEGGPNGRVAVPPGGKKEWRRSQVLAGAPMTPNAVVGRKRHATTPLASRRVVRLVVPVLVTVGSLTGSAPAGAHGGGLDSSGGHYCREAGANSGKCAPEGSYHCHSAGCVPPGGGENTATTVATTTAPPPPPPPPTTTRPPATTAAPVITTTAGSTTTTEATTAATEDDVEIDSVPVDSPNESDPVAGALGLVILGGAGYGGYRLAQRRRNAHKSG